MPESGRYEFTTEWTIPAPPERVWTELMGPERWPHWWPGVVRVEPVRAGGPDGVGAVRRYTFRSRLPYRLTFTMETTRVEPHQIIEGRATGELEGHGCWRLYPGTGTRVLYDWHVGVTKPWMKRLDPLARKLFAWNHDVVMEWGRRGLIRRIQGWSRRDFLTLKFEVLNLKFEVQAAPFSGLAVYLLRADKAQVKGTRQNRSMFLPSVIGLRPLAFCLAPGSRT